jgi:hypothetical protein
VSELSDRLHADLTAAMKARDELRVATLRLTLSAVRTEEVAGDAARELTDDEVITVLRREERKRREAAEAFEQAGRADSAARERAEAEIIAGYLPRQLSDDELDALVRSALADAGLSGPKAMGAAMKAVTAVVAGRADGRRVSSVVRQVLASG